VNRYAVGQPVKLTFTFNPSAPADPGTVVAKTRDPHGTLTTYTYGVDAALVRESQGVYALTVTPTLRGLWWYRGEGTAPAEAAAEASFEVSGRF
jgi:hypothetical protein